MENLTVDDLAWLAEVLGSCPADVLDALVGLTENGSSVQACTCA